MAAVAPRAPAAYGEVMAQTSTQDAAAPAAPTAPGACSGRTACTTLYLASTVSAYLLSELGGRRTLAGALAGMAAITALSLVIVRLSARLAYPGGGYRDRSSAARARCGSDRRWPRRSASCS